MVPFRLNIVVDNGPQQSLWREPARLHNIW